MHFRYYKSEKLILFLIGLTVLIGAFVTFIIHPCVEHAPDTIRNFIVFTELFSVPFSFQWYSITSIKLVGKRKYSNG